MRIAYFDCFSGISGDMTLGALIDAGLDFGILKKELAKLNVKGYTLNKRRVKRGALAGTKFDCITQEGRHHTHKSLREIMSLIENSALSPKAKKISKDIFFSIGKAEAKVHGIGKNSDVRLHELGEVDSLVDIVGTAIAIDNLSIDKVYASDITMGRTVVSTHHGMLPIPGPAALELMKGVPSRISEIDAELVTPTGAGIIKTLSSGFGAMPSMKIRRIGYGAGSRKLDGIPNMLRVMIGESVDSFREDSVTVMETNIDDMNPQNFEYFFENIFKEGALDAYTENIYMKKSRPAFKLTVIAPHSKSEHIASVIFRETTSIGIRYSQMKRFVLDRKTVKAKTRFGYIDVKVSTGPGGIKTVSPEYASCVGLAKKHGVTLDKVRQAARSAVKEEI